MKAIFDNYIENSFGEYRQVEEKKKHFIYNYKKYLLPESDALDIGIGRGEMLTVMQSLNVRGHGVDISPSTVGFCKSIGLSCEVTEDTTQWLLQNPKKYNVITCLDVLEHIPREQAVLFLEAIRGALAPGGILIVQVPNLQSPFGYLHHFNDFTHVSGFVEHSLQQILMASGFKNMSFHGFEEIYGFRVKTQIKLLVRCMFRKVVKFLRLINANPNPKILDPVFFAIAEKS